MRSSLVAVLAICGMLMGEGKAEAALDAVVKVILDDPTDPRSKFGTGVIVRMNPPTVATCAHVVAGKRDVFVSYKKNRPLRVTRVKAYPSEDLAFLLVDQDEIPAFPTEAHWSPGYTFATGVKYVSGQLAGYHLRSEAFEWPVEVHNFQALKDMAVLPPSVPGADLSVAMLTRDLLGHILYRGDSGGPIFVDGNVIALASGYVQLDEEDPTLRIPFVVPAKNDVPLPQDMESLPAPLVTVFGGRLKSANWSDPLEGLTLTSDMQPCAEAFLTSFGRVDRGFYRDLEYFPVGVPDAATDHCKQKYELARAAAIREDDENAAAARKEARAQWLLSDSAATTALASASADNDKDLLAQLSPATRQALDGDKRGDKKTNTPQQEKDGLLLLQLAERHRERARLSAATRARILATGQP